MKISTKGLIIIMCISIIVFMIIMIYMFSTNMGNGNQAIANPTTNGFNEYLSPKIISLGRLEVKEEVRISTNTLDNRIYVITDTNTGTEYMFIDSDDGATIIELRK